MNTKICIKCGIKKDIANFHVKKRCIFNVNSICKECRQSPSANEKSRKLLLIPNNFKCCSKCKKIKPLIDFGNDKSKKDGLSSHCKECKIKVNKLYRQHPEIKKHEKQQQKLYQQSTEFKKLLSEANKKRYYLDPTYKLKIHIRGRTSDFFKGYKSTSTEKLLGCSYEFARKWIEAQFTSEMNWNNIHIDHIRPLSSYTMLEQDQFKACNWKNLQPLLEKDNLEKSDNWDGTDENLTYSRQTLLSEVKRNLIKQFDNLLIKN